VLYRDALRKLFRIVRAQTALVALDGASVVGCVGVAPSGAFQLTMAQRLVLFASLVALGARSLSSVGRWNAVSSTLNNIIRILDLSLSTLICAVGNLVTDPS
jgi:hypothetical protein